MAQTSVDVEIKKSGSATTVVRLDNKKISFSGNTGKLKVSPGDYALQWFVIGAPAAKYKVEVTKPKSAAWTIEGTLDATQKDAGVQWLRFKGSEA